MSVPNSLRLLPVRRLLNDWRLSKQKVNLDIEIHATVGFFAQLNWCLYALAYCEQHNLNPRIRLTGPIYSDLPRHDWFHDFFEETDAAVMTNEASSLGPRHPLRIITIQETTLAVAYGTSMTIENAHRLFSAFYRVNDMIAAHVDAFVKNEFSSDDVIGLHFRGTDKNTEAEPVDWACCFRSVMKLAADRPEVKKVFVSSDDAKFIEWFDKEAKGTLSVIVHPDQERSWDGKAIHTSALGNSSQKGFEALVNCLLLSRCSALIRTASFLSGWSSIFNPDLSITLLNKPYANKCWFPDRELIKRSDTRYCSA
jgi:hypothetical protein